MGSWGPALFSDDLACDVRDEYREMIEDGVDDDAASRGMMERYASVLDDADEGSVFWMALAFTQSKVGRLEPQARDRALEVIDEGIGLGLWEEDPKLLAKRKAALVKARAQLTGPQPKRRKLRPPSRHTTDLEPGDVVGYRSGDSYALFRVARINESRVAVAPVLVALRHDPATLPSPDRLGRLRNRKVPRLVPTKTGLAPWWTTSFHVMVIRKVDYTDAGFWKHGRMPSRRGDADVSPGTYIDWTGLAERLDAWLGA